MLSQDATSSSCFLLCLSDEQVYENRNETKGTQQVHTCIVVGAQEGLFQNNASYEVQHILSLSEGERCVGPDGTAELLENQWRERAIFISCMCRVGAKIPAFTRTRACFPPPCECGGVETRANFSVLCEG